MPPFVKSLAFWKAISLIVATLVAYFFPDYKIDAVMVEFLVLAVLQFFGVTPELRARGLL